MVGALVVVKSKAVGVCLGVVGQCKTAAHMQELLIWLTKQSLALRMGLS